jgi:SAM-dependent methyltransferase
MTLELLDLRGGCSCLDVGSGWGQFSIPMAQLGCKVVSLDLTLERLRVLKQIARQEGAGLQLVKGNILTFPFRDGTFDLALFSGSLEWVGMGRKEGQTIRECQIAALKNARRAVRNGGIVCVGIENSLGLKYLMGARDDHTGLPGYGFRDEEGATSMMRSVGVNQATARTWGLVQLQKMAEEAGLAVQSAYGCFPDYKLPRHLIPLAEVNQFILRWPMDWVEHHGDRGEAMGDQESIGAAYKQFAENGIAQWVCPSYFMLLVKI